MNRFAIFTMAAIAAAAGALTVTLSAGAITWMAVPDNMDGAALHMDGWACL